MPRWNRRSFVLRTGLAAASLCAPTVRAQSEGTPRSPERADLQSLIEPERKRIADAMARDDIPGAAVCLIHEGKPVWTEGFGVTGQRSRRRVTADTIFSIQSTSKHFTATAIMLAVQQGILDLDEPITAYLPSFTVQSRFERAPQEKMTLRILLANRAGFTHETTVGNNYDPESASFEAHVHSISQTWLRFPVGERYRYSNLGFDLAGYILQVRSGMPFTEYLKAMLFEPLGMKDSTAASDVYAARADRAVGHRQGYAKVPLKTPLIASGGVYTNARDIAAYCMFHLNRGKANGRTLLKEELWNQMHAFSFGGDYGLGVIRQDLRHGGTNLRMLSHAGGGFGFGSVFQYCPQAGLAWVALFNRPSAGAYRFGEQLIDEALTRRLGAARPRLPVDDLAPAELPATWLRKYAGNYVGRSSMVELIVKDGMLVMQQGDTVTPIRFTSPTEMYIATANGNAVTYRYYAATALEPAHLECSLGERSLDYNEGGQDAAGPDKAEWARYLGAYRIYQWGQPGETVTIQRKNGYLYLNQIRLITELEPGLFFTSDGEAVDFRHNEPTWRNIRLRRV
jgi:CubicO group peptidase (beta-lactamase class C family)